MLFGIFVADDAPTSNRGPTDISTSFRCHFDVNYAWNQSNMNGLPYKMSIRYWVYLLVGFLIGTGLIAHACLSDPLAEINRGKPEACLSPTDMSIQEVN